MTWYNENYKRRMPVTIDGSATTSSTVQFTFLVPDDWDDFWDNIKDTGIDVVLTKRDGTLLSFERFSFTYSTRTCLLRADNLPVNGEYAIHVIWLYWDYADETVDQSTSQTMVGSPLTASVYLGAPFGRIVNLTTINNVFTSQNMTVFSKQPEEIVDIWYPINHLLTPRSLSYNERLDYIGIDYILVEVINSSSVNQPSMYALEETKLINGFIKIRVKSGTTDTDYVVRCIIVCTDSEKYIQSSLLQVKKLLPT